MSGLKEMSGLQKKRCFPGLDAPCPGEVAEALTGQRRVERDRMHGTAVEEVPAAAVGGPSGVSPGRLPASRAVGETAHGAELASILRNQLSAWGPVLIVSALGLRVG